MIAISLVPGQSPPRNFRPESARSPTLNPLKSSYPFNCHIQQLRRSGDASWNK
ncbi:hypothetical protein BS78_04G103200 [Paspalum vaginatum]|nr:hypothetical protein BS78_04G103200 [Paspalum vaginatum]